jgi:hypothetical protein
MVHLKFRNETKAYFIYVCIVPKNQLSMLNNLWFYLLAIFKNIISVEEQHNFPSQCRSCRNKKMIIMLYNFDSGSDTGKYDLLSAQLKN